jgi:hypothetical protein
MDDDQLARLKAEFEKSREAMNDLISSPTMEAIEAAIKAPMPKGLQDALNDLNRLPASRFDYRDPAFQELLNPTPADERTVTLLRRVHAELEGLASLLTEGAQQTAAVVEVTKANLTALSSVIDELKTSRRSSDRASGALIALTVAILIASAVAAVAVAPQAVREFGDALNYLRGHL